MRVITQAAAVPAGLEGKVGPAGFVHGWIYVGTPLFGQSVHHAQLGHGVVTHVTDHHVHVRFTKTGEDRVLPVEHDPANVRRLENMSDDDLYTHMMSKGEGHRFDLAANELDRRDRAENDGKIRALYDEVPVRPEDRDRVYKGLTDLGENPEDAWSHAHGLRSHDQRRKAVIAQLRGQGYTGAGFDELARKSWKDEVHRRALHAEGETNGYLTNAAGRAKGIDGWDLFHGPESAARKYASDELKQYWDKHGRGTFDDYAHQLTYGFQAAGRRRDDFLQ